ncbi:putative nuclear migration protein [Aspergillus lucknowensis]|uniref:Meiotic cell cortex C-terminal pleckstrin homology-domain-containing protein n=1 Tax=Aspergillus lucknowensis TaxID=176173 RepID=A0ABR4M6N7_9EURO
MATEAIYQRTPAANAFPTPSTTPKRPPSMHARADSSPGPASSPASLPNHLSPDGRSDFDEIVDEDVISPLDPRRFTPTLHASLVSEILSLRRDVENKTKAIDVLERSLDESRIENEELAEKISKHSKESRSLKHQIQLLEGGSSSALAELAKERDDALDGISEVRRKLEQAQKKARSREEELERATKIWNRDKEAWDGERRNLERKVHVVEGRLKVVLNEVAAAQAAGSLGPASNTDGVDASKEASTGKDSDSTSIHSSSQGRRRTSVTSLSSDGADEDDFHNARYSVMSAAHMPGSQTNLADELAFDEEEEFDALVDALDDDIVLPGERPSSVQSQDAKARKILGLSLQGSLDGYVIKPEETAELKNSQMISAPSVQYSDTGVQYSPPPSPKLASKTDHGANELEDNTKMDLYLSKDSSTLTLSIDMVSSSSQTVDDLPTPPWTPRVEAPPTSPVVKWAPMVSTSVQTNTPVEAKAETHPLDAGVKSPFMEVPMIAIHPPQSEPPSPRGSVVLPPQTKSVSCQAEFKPVIESRTVGIQTEPIRIDQRPVKLPARLLPSAIPDFPLSTVSLEHHIQPYQPPPPRATKAEEKPPPPAVEPVADRTAQSKPGPVQAYPGNNDNGPLSDDSKASLRRPLRTSSLFAGFEQASDEESPDATRDVFTDDELLNRPFASYKLRRGKLVSAHERRRSLDEATLPEVDEDHFEGANSSAFRSSPRSSWSRSGAPGARQQDMRRTAMISSGAATHQRIRARSPSEPSLDSGSGSNTSSAAPPFPVPIRLSSRKFPQSGSDGRQSPTPSRNFSDRPRPSIVRRPTLRRVRSAAAMSQTDQTERRTTRSSPAMSISSYTPDSPRQHPPLPFDDITMPRNQRSTYGRQPRRPSASQHLTHERQDSTATSVQPTSVVDAIAQTMVGEWMWKYVRRRRSFGGDKDTWEGRNAEEVSASITSSGVRHKRWVWLAPYERAVMWSSKQPTSGPALLGKSGRKLVIQSVLDVKDDNPLPKGFNGPAYFNRSILILTPQRALKFTATSIERHYVWLTALSFLSHSAMGVQDLAALPPVPQEECVRPTPTATLRRNPIRDSIRIAKGRPRPFPKGKKRSFTNNNHPEPVPEIPANLDIGSRASDEAADPPTIPRFSNHSRKRSNTAPRMPIPNIRSFSSQNTMPSMRSSPDPQGQAPSSHSQGFASVRSSFSHRTSENSMRTGNFFDAIGTVRMEAFIDQTESNRYRAAAARRHTRKASTPWSMNQGYPELDSPYEEGEYRHHDPFQGF